MNWLIVKKLWENDFVRGIAAAGALVAALLAYTFAQRSHGAEQQKIKEKDADRARLEEIEAVSDDAVALADRVSVNSPNYGDDRVSDEPLPDAHYRD